jgi:hypothetical protein
LRQVFAVTFKTYSRPIPSPVKYLRPARETCEHCHWPQRFTGDKFLVNTSYKDDEKNTPQTDVLLLKIGGRTWQGLVGIHGHHLSDGARIHYIATDTERQVIPAVYYTDDAGKTIEFLSTDSKPTQQQLDKGEHRAMDCIDCHNRPTHAFEMPESAVDKQMSIGAISPELPYIKKKAVELLKVDYPSRMRRGSVFSRNSTISTVPTTPRFIRLGAPWCNSRRRASLQSICAMFSLKCG